MLSCWENFVKDLLYQKIHLLRDQTFDADDLNSLRILKTITGGPKNGFR